MGIRSLIKTIAIILLLSLTACGGGGGGIEPKVKASEPRDGAWNSNRDYEQRYSNLQDMVDNQYDVELECGTYEGSVIVIRNAIRIHGKGRCTKTPSFRMADHRVYSVVIENLEIDGDIDGYSNIGIDFEGCSTCVVNNVHIKNVDYGVFLYGQAYYNSFTNLHIRPRKTCYEIGGVANSNHISEGSCLGTEGDSYGVVLSSVNNTSISYTSFEKHKVGIDMSGTVNTAVIIGIRLESMDIGIDATGSRNETILGIHYSGVSENIKD